MKRGLLNLMWISLLLGACGNENVENEHKDYILKNDTVHVFNPLLSEKLKMGKAILKPYSRQITTAATIQAIPTQFVYVAAPFSGRIIKSYVNLGESVKQGSPLFQINSPDFTTAQKDFFQALSSVQLARKDYKRKKDLLHNGVNSQKDLEEAENILLICEKEYENSISALKVYHIENPHDMTLGQPLIVKTPITGDVIENNIIVGQYLKDDSESIAIVADLTKVWITAQIKEKDICQIKEGDELHLTIAASSDREISARVFHIEKMVDESTRSIRVLAECDNKDGFLKIGMYATVYFKNSPIDLIHIHDKALLQDEFGHYVFVQSSTNEYVKTLVEVEITENGEAIIAKGLKENDVIINEGGYYLK